MIDSIPITVLDQLLALRRTGLYDLAEICMGQPTIRRPKGASISERDSLAELAQMESMESRL
jgi:hypothetical protein